MLRHLLCKWYKKIRDPDLLLYCLLNSSAKILRILPDWSPCWRGSRSILWIDHLEYKNNSTDRQRKYIYIYIRIHCLNMNIYKYKCIHMNKYMYIYIQYMCIYIKKNVYIIYEYQYIYIYMRIYIYKRKDIYIYMYTKIKNNKTKHAQTCIHIDILHEYTHISIHIQHIQFNIYASTTPRTPFWRKRVLFDGPNKICKYTHTKLKVIW